MKELANPNIDTDMAIIANTRLGQLKEHGLVQPDSKQLLVKHFKCHLRGYLVSKDRLLAMFDPKILKPAAFSQVIPKNYFPIECWILENDQVKDFGELRMSM